MSHDRARVVHSALAHHRHLRRSRNTRLLMRCKTCGEERPLSAFRKEPRNKSGRRGSCNLCRNARRRAQYDPDRKRADNQKNAWKVRAWRYGSSEDELLALLAEQDGCCAICDRVMKKPCVDHDHETGQVRGLLCHACNNILGLANDSLYRLERAKQYLLGCQVDKRNNPSEDFDLEVKTE